MIVFAAFKRIYKRTAEEFTVLKKGKIVMAKNYLHIPAVGQLDDKACWAACLKWWYRATKSVTKSQRKLIDKYNYLTDEWGAMGYASMERLIERNHMTKEVFHNASQFTPDALWKHLKKGPVFVAFTETQYAMKHVNVVYDMAGISSVSLYVMEPQAFEKPDLSYAGEHTIKNINQFNQMGSVIVGSL